MTESQREVSRQLFLESYFRCQRLQDPSLPLPMWAQELCDPIPSGFNSEGHIPEEREWLGWEIVTEGP